jgi:hypothetical protein
MPNPMIVRVGARSSKAKTLRTFDGAVGRISQAGVRTITVGKRPWRHVFDIGSYKNLFIDALVSFLDNLFFNLTRSRPGLLKVNSNLFENTSPYPAHGLKVATVHQAIAEIRSLKFVNSGSDENYSLLLLTFDAELIPPLVANFPEHYVVYLESDTPLGAESIDFIHHVVGEMAKITCRMTFYFGNSAVFRQNYNYPTRRTGVATSLSYSEDSASLLIRKYHYLQNRIPEPLVEEIFSQKILRSSNAISIWHLIRKFLALTVQARLSSIPKFRAYMPPRKVWSVALASTTGKEDSLHDFVRIRNPEGSWLADPFLVENGNETFLFVEEFDIAKGRGEISVAEIRQGTPPNPTVCLTENFHLSFPYIFRYSDKLYMCPETHNAKEVRIYKSEEFPHRWSLAASHLLGEDCSDTIIFEFNGSWWLITTKESASGGDFYSELFVYFAKDPICGPWKEHPQNPVVVDSSRGRNGGFHMCEGRLFRFGQEFGIFEYGVGLHSYEITLLTQFEYRETGIQCQHFRGLSSQVSTHHMDMSSKYIVVDSKS